MSDRTVAYAPAAPAAMPTTRSRMSGRVRESTSLGISWLGRSRARRYDNKITPAVARITVNAERAACPPSAMAILAARPSTGAISGAMSMAPMTSAGEFRSRPMTATSADSVIITVNRCTQPSSGCTWMAVRIRRRSSGVTFGIWNVPAGNRRLGFPAAESTGTGAVAFVPELFAGLAG